MSGRAAPEQLRDVEIVAVGAQGDGIAETPDGPLFIPYTVPGDRRRVRVGADGRCETVERLEDGPHRQTPPCPHFGGCGGCSVQHMDAAAYAAWKRQIVVEALARRGIETEVAPLVPAAPGTRRRVRLVATPMGTGAALGFRERRSHRIAAISQCPVAGDEIVALIAPLTGLVAAILPRRSQSEVVVTLTPDGLDVLIQCAAEPTLAGRERLGRFAEDNDVARVSWIAPRSEAEPIVVRRPPRIVFGPATVSLPPVSFLQPTADGETALREQVVEALARCRRVADLFCGCGAFALPLAAGGAAVLAVDTDGHAVAALDAAARGSGLGPKVTAEERHLGRRPLSPDELSKLDGVVLDPPRAGAAEQVAVLAASAVPVIAYASCNPQTFARDARTLLDGGYTLEGVTPVDQFLWSEHVELIGVFRR